jgi:hypothetical protein
MGRWYYGDISGKCWFGVQDSNDASNFGVEPTDEYTFFGCGCTYEPENPKEEDKMAFCTCYESYEEHMEDIKEDLEDMDPDDRQTWHSESSICYYFKEEDLPKVQEVVKKLDKEVGHYLKDYVLEEDQGEGITYDFEFSNKLLGKKKHEKIARLCLGLQIIKSIETKGQCCFNVET